MIKGSKCKGVKLPESQFQAFRASTESDHNHKKYQAIPSTVAQPVALVKSCDMNQSFSTGLDFAGEIPTVINLGKPFRNEHTRTPVLHSHHACVELDELQETLGCGIGKAPRKCQVSVTLNLGRFWTSSN